MATTALLIQGPLVSVGRDGAHAHEKAHSVSVDTVGLVQQQAEAARRAGFDFVSVSTWNDAEFVGQLAGAAAIDQLTVLDDPLPCPAYDFQPHKDNRIRQAYGCHEGLQALLGRYQPEFIARIRTDQALDLRILREALLASEPGQLRVLGIYRNYFMHVYDFVIAGATADVRQHYEALAAFDYFPFRNYVHSDIFFKDAFAQCRGQAPAAAFFPATSYFLDVQIPMFRHMLGRRLSPLSQAVAQSIVWRGTPLSDVVTGRMIGQEEWLGGHQHELLQTIPSQGVTLSPLNMPHFIALDRMADLGLYNQPLPGRLHRLAARAAGALQTKLRPAPQWRAE